MEGALDHDQRPLCPSPGSSISHSCFLGPLLSSWPPFPCTQNLVSGWDDPARFLQVCHYCFCRKLLKMSSFFVSSFYSLKSWLNPTPPIILSTFLYYLSPKRHYVKAHLRGRCMYPYTFFYNPPLLVMANYANSVNPSSLEYLWLDVLIAPQIPYRAMSFSVKIILLSKFL